MVPYSEGKRCYPTCNGDPTLYSGIYTNQNQFVNFQVEDNGTAVTWKATGYMMDRATGQLSVLVTMDGVAGRTLFFHFCLFFKLSFFNIFFKFYLIVFKRGNNFKNSSRTNPNTNSNTNPKPHPNS